MSDTSKKCKGFILLREYPGCHKKVGAFEPYTTGEYLSYPEVWKPVYEENEIVETEKYIIEIAVRKKF